ncbi:AbrB/MazE/SpoVT family DNA-binding domain-containing protein [Heliorestis acidaminivorans]|uniref:AbrB/MazE/SpoVT family DNA-binding domain-containing protein n=1 Tax=Heliorestis acidaminivorans TaxID=553427 RepID=A0A6I0F8A3_9FIRM|nr:AbrB/MazE/SpoVT family DNA-binding domain-containing protein [Heliorestis acidaminivorans]KAB2953728.1 AbrB/MazE/SpoVT family DNA-binding domain-containing protein [Heliorestis acidaminivorans]
MEIAKVMAKGQVTIPMSVRKKLNLKEGDKVAFIEKDGVILIANSTMMALLQVQDAFEGEAKRLGLESEEDVVALVKEVRREMCEEKQDKTPKN